MRSVLVPFDGSRASEAALRSVVNRAHDGDVDGIHVLNIQPSFDGYVRQFIDRQELLDFQRESADAVLAQAHGMLDGTGLRFRMHRRSGDEAGTVAQVAQDIGVDEIVVGGEDKGLLSDLLARVLVRRILRLARVPVVVVKQSANAPRYRPSAVRWNPSQT